MGARCGGRSVQPLAFTSVRTRSLLKSKIMQMSDMRAPQR